MENKEFVDNEKRFGGESGELHFETKGKDPQEAFKDRENNDLAKSIEKYMPIGSVVKLEGNFNKYMIIGFDCKTKEEKMMDYLACDYPYGVNEEHRVTLFNHSQIDKIYHIGFVNNQERAFKKKYADKDDINNKSI